MQTGADPDENQHLLLVAPYGANFAIQQIDSTGDDGTFWRRKVRPATGVTQAWQKFTAGGGDGGPSLTGKHVVILGDSQVENGLWPGLMADRLGCAYTKGGIGGSRLTQMTGSLAGMAGVDVADAIASGSWTAMEAAAQARYDDTSGADDNRPIVAALAAVDWSAVDIVICHWGTNDWNNSVPIGNPDRSTDRATIRGAVNYAMDRLLSTWHTSECAVGRPCFPCAAGLGRRSGQRYLSE